MTVPTDFDRKLAHGLRDLTRVALERGRSAPASTGPGPSTSHLDRRRALAVAGVALAVVALVGLSLALTRSDGKAAKVVVAGQPTGPAEVSNANPALVALEMPDGEPTSLRRLVSGPRLAIVTLWAPWCAPCLEDLGLLDRVDPVDLGVDIVSVAVQESAGTARTYLSENGVGLAWVLDPNGDLFAAVHGEGLPLTLLFGPDGAVVARQNGRFSGVSEVRAFVASGLPYTSSGADAAATTGAVASTSTAPSADSTGLGCRPVERPTSGDGAVPTAGPNNRLSTQITWSNSFILDPPAASARPAIDESDVPDYGYGANPVTKLAVLTDPLDRGWLGENRLVWAQFYPQRAHTGPGGIPGGSQPSPDAPCEKGVAFTDANTGDLITFISQG